MIINEFENPLTAEDARKISINNRDDSRDRTDFRYLMASIRDAASVGHTRFVTIQRSKYLTPSEQVQKALSSFGYRVVEKRAYQWDNEANKWSDSKPALDSVGNEQFFLEITWG